VDAKSEKDYSGVIEDLKEHYKEITVYHEDFLFCTWGKTS